MPVTLQSITVNDGEGVFIQMTLPGDPTPQSYQTSLVGQQSVVRHLRLQFNVPVAMQPTAVTITPRAGVQVLGGALQPNQLPVVANLHPLPGGGEKVWIATFAGDGVDSPSGAIKQGVYDVAVDPAKVASGPTNMDPAPPFTFATMFGAQIASGTIVRSVLEPNLATNFGASLASPGGAHPYVPALDRNLDGRIDGSDVNQAGQAAGAIWVF